MEALMLEGGQKVGWHNLRLENLVHLLHKDFTNFHYTNFHL